MKIYLQLEAQTLRFGHFSCLVVYGSNLGWCQVWSNNGDQMLFFCNGWDLLDLIVADFQIFIDGSSRMVVVVQDYLLVHSYFPHTAILRLLCRTNACK